MPRLIGRLDRLEKTSTPAKGPPKLLRLIVTRMDNPEDPPTCRRTLRRSTLAEPGTLTEIVTFYGSRDHLNNEQMERFIQSFPIEEIGAGNA